MSKVAEYNYTRQFAHFIKSNFAVRAIELKKREGRPFNPEEILQGIEKIAGIVDAYRIAL